jgi:hypothetical protein
MSKKAKQAGCIYTFFFPNGAAKYNEDERKRKRKEDDVKLHKVRCCVDT